MTEKLISIIMPVLNEESRIHRALKSIRAQSINRDNIEILVIDGGSTDKTVEIAKSYCAKIIINEKRVPEEAKRIGLSASIGKYVVFMDADEELTDPLQLEKRISLFQSNPHVKAIIVNSYQTPAGYPNLTRYTNCYGDPFSYFVHRNDCENLIISFKKRYVYKEYDSGEITFKLAEKDIVPIGDGGTTMLDLEYIKQEFKNKIYDFQFASTVFTEVVVKTGCFGIIAGDAVTHYTNVKFKQFLSKLKFRIFVNLNTDSNISGIAARAVLVNKLNKRKYLYLLYTLIPLFVLADSIIISIRKRNISFMIHFLLAYYILFQTALSVIMKALKKRPADVLYGK